MFARAAGADPRRTITLPLDDAGWDTDPDRAWKGLRFASLPPCTPEFQSAKHFWRLGDEPIVNRYFDRLTEIQDRIEQHCRDLGAQPDTVAEDWLHL
ncbi:hypothetical protein [Methylobacterium sp. Leaf108]|uniref:hypothetical protein n=1 Tax=Methylobacterium sp. Leaf108 TaxID=1736256 RepID=UPI0006FEF6ED|nr:hypothetical protein [Methylobacterium sp. Leaf108]KQP51822.1 hypothetical protein ASF39_08640 [Methylobacterium sp. Leaf108]